MDGDKPLAARIAGLIASRRRLRERLATRLADEVEAKTEPPEDPFVARACDVLADAVGFAGVSAFSRRFRERFHESPAAFSRQARASTDR